jgi:threonine/homoserine/homoserine lactone efflux protein
MYYINALLTGILVTSVGALPLGLVNLSVLDISNKNGYRAGMKIAYGASIIEVIYGLIAILAGMFILKLFEEYSHLNYIIAALIGLVGVMFLFKKTSNKTNSAVSLNGFWKGIFLNLISIQVFLFWIVAIAYLYSHNKFNDSPSFVITFLIGIGAGKVGILWLYARMSRTILLKSKILSNNINKLIGSVLLVTVIIQLLKF